MINFRFLITLFWVYLWVCAIFTNNFGQFCHNKCQNEIEKKNKKGWKGPISPKLKTKPKEKKGVKPFDLFFFIIFLLLINQNSTIFLSNSY